MTAQNAENFEKRMSNYINTYAETESQHFQEQKSKILNNGEELSETAAEAMILDQAKHQFIRKNIKEYMEIYFDQPAQGAERMMTEPLICDNGGFESDFLHYQGFTTTYTNGSNNCTPLDGSVPSMYVPVTLPEARRFEIMSTGTDPLVGIDKTKFGSKSLRINSQYGHTSTHSCSGSHGVDKLVKTFKVTEATRDVTIWYAVVLENPSGHVNSQPFLNISCDRDMDNELCFDASILRCDSLYTDVYCTYDSLDVLDWACHRFKIPEDYVDSTATIEIVIADCGLGAHFGYAYIDGICEECTGSSLGSGTLSEDIGTIPGIEYKSCDGLSARVCGAYTLPSLCGEWEVKEVVVPGSVISNVVIDTIGLTYCFDFPIYNFDNLECMEIYNQIIFTNEAFALPIQLSNTIEICESLFESYTYDITVGDCEVAAADGGSINISDDHYYVEVDISDTDGENWNIIRKLDNPYPNESGEHEIADGTGDTNMVLGPFMIQDGNWEMVIQFGDCTYTEYIEAPDYCSGCPAFYEMEIDNIQCVNETDWTFDIFVPSTGNPGDYYKFSGDTYLFGVTYTINGGEIKNGCKPVDIEAIFVNSMDCSFKMTICPPKPCDESSVAHCEFSIYLNEKDCYKDGNGNSYTTYTINYVDNYYNNTCYSLEDVTGAPINDGVFTTPSGDVGVIKDVDAYLTVCRSNTSCSIIDFDEEPCCKTIFLPALECKDRIGLRDDRSEELPKSNQVAIYPNPIKNNVLQIYTSESCDYIIYNLSGQLVDEGRLEKGINQVEIITSLGIYFIRTSNSDGSHTYQKFIK